MVVGSAEAPNQEDAVTLDGTRIGVTAFRKAPELAAALERRGATVDIGTTIGGDVPVEAERILADTDTIIDARPQWLVASTGVGMRLWADAAAAHGRLDELVATAAAARCVARGAKAVGGLHALKADAVWTSPSQTDADVVGWLTGHVLPGDTVAVQLHGTARPSTFAPLEEVGADVLSVATYRHAFPDDLAPGRALIDAVVAAQLDVVTFTSPGAARNLIEIARLDGTDRAEEVVEAFRTQVATAVIGPVTASALEELGIPVWISPTRWRTGDLLRSIERWWLTRDVVPTDRPQLQLLPQQRAVIGPDGDPVELGERGYAVLAALSRRPGVVCAPEHLLAEAWGHQAPDDASAVKHQIARLRRKLDGFDVAITAVRGVGYRLDGAVTDGPPPPPQTGTS